MQVGKKPLDRRISWEMGCIVGGCSMVVKVCRKAASKKKARVCVVVRLFFSEGIVFCGVLAAMSSKLTTEADVCGWRSVRCGWCAELLRCEMTMDASWYLGSRTMDKTSSRCKSPSKTCRTGSGRVSGAMHWEGHGQDDGGAHFSFYKFGQSGNEASPWHSLLLFLFASRCLSLVFFFDCVLLQLRFSSSLAQEVRLHDVPTRNSAGTNRCQWDQLLTEAKNQCRCITMSNATCWNPTVSLNPDGSLQMSSELEKMIRFSTCRAALNLCFLQGPTHPESGNRLLRGAFLQSERLCARGHACRSTPCLGSCGNQMCGRIRQSGSLERAGFVLTPTSINVVAAGVDSDHSSKTKFPVCLFEIVPPSQNYFLVASHDVTRSFEICLCKNILPRCNVLDAQSFLSSTFFVTTCAESE